MKQKTINKKFYNQIVEVLTEAKNFAYKTINFAAVLANWQIGRLIVEEEQNGKERAEYGAFLLKQLSERLTSDFGSGYDLTNLKLFRKFYLEFQYWLPVNQKGDSSCNLLQEFSIFQKGDIPCNLLQDSNNFRVYKLRTDLSWSHYRILMRIENPDARQFYINEAADQCWNVEQLKRQINSFYFERLTATTDKQSIMSEANENLQLLATKKDFLKDPNILEFLGFKPDIKFLEQELEQAIIDNLQNFLLELGKGFAFVARQQLIRTETKDFYIDLVFYNYILKCFVLIELKTRELSHQDIGQLDMYVRMYDDLKRSETDNPTIGILLCADKDETIVKYSILNDNKQLIAKKYMLYLPSEEELIKQINYIKK
ncbi:MAG TPA: PDDEXK nuclease domain-containing protein [Candidatus Kapabacteria bacterium]|nr:PDDEXK nuclease domain-containing protein [Candidatus Kapabacteria bacterium]HPO61769.1 PDDEXK nuclease domain-containing protein [Candidatus Kapabacteria bacterium]